MIRDGLLFVRVYALICTGIALDCLRASLTGGIPMPEGTHGHAIYIIPGELWSLVSFVPAMGAAILAGGERHYLLAVCAAISGMVNIAIGVFSADAEMGFIQSRVSFGAGMLWVSISLAAVADGIGFRARTWARSIIRRFED